MRTYQVTYKFEKNIHQIQIEAESMMIVDGVYRFMNYDEHSPRYIPVASFNVADVMDVEV